MLGRRQNALKADHEEITEQMGANIPGAPTHVVLLDAANALRKRRLRFPPGFSFRFLKSCDDRSDGDLTNGVEPGSRSTGKP